MLSSLSTPVRRLLHFRLQYNGRSAPLISRLMQKKYVPRPVSRLAPNPSHKGHVRSLALIPPTEFSQSPLPSHITNMQAFRHQSSCKCLSDGTLTLQWISFTRPQCSFNESYLLRFFPLQADPSLLFFLIMSCKSSTLSDPPSCAKPDRCVTAVIFMFFFPPSDCPWPSLFPSFALTNFCSSLFPPQAHTWALLCIMYVSLFTFPLRR